MKGLIPLQISVRARRVWENSPSHWFDVGTINQVSRYVSDLLLYALNLPKALSASENSSLYTVDLLASDLTKKSTAVCTS